MRRLLPAVVTSCLFGLVSFAPSAHADDHTGTPPPDAKALVEAPKAPGDAPKFEDPVDGTTVALSAGGLLTSGNSRVLAATANGSIESRFNDNGLGASLLGNYGQGAPPGDAIRVSAENVQGRLRYDRYIIERASLFLITTGRHDRFQGIDFRLNIDPGLKYLFLKEQANTLWGEGGYDLQYDIRRNEARGLVDDDKKPVLDASGQQVILDKTFVDHSARLFVGYRRAFNKEVTLGAGLEYLQSVVDADRYRMNFDALLAAKVGGGFAIGAGFGLRYDHAPLPGKEKLDTSTTLSLIYAFSDVPEAKPATCPCPEPTPVSEPAPVPAPGAAAPATEPPAASAPATISPPAAPPATTEPAPSPAP